MITDRKGYGQMAQQEQAEQPIVAIRLNPEEHDDYRRACQRVERSMAGQGRLLIRDWLAANAETTAEPEDIAA